MSIKVDPTALADLSSLASRISSEIGTTAQSVQSIRWSVPASVMDKGNLYGSFDSICNRIESAKTRVGNVGAFLSFASGSYSETESNLCRTDPGTAAGGYLGSAASVSSGGNTHRCQTAAGGVAGMDSAALFSSDPVNLSNGNYVYEKEFFHFDTPISINFRLFYNVCDTKSGVLGKGWLHNFEKHAEEKDGLIYIMDEDRSEQIFEPKGDNLYEPVPGSFGKLYKTESNYIYENDERETLSFGLDGKFLTAETIDGWKITVNYQEGRVVSVFCTDGIVIHFEYDTNEKLCGIQDHAGRKCSFSYTKNMLTSVCDAIGNVTKYEYDETGRLAKIIAPSGDLSVMNTYDYLGRTIRQEFADGGMVSYLFNDEKRLISMKRQNGSVVDYYHDHLFRNTRTVFPDGEERYTYNSHNQRISHTDKLGRITRYEYDERSQLTKFINADGNCFSLSYNEDGQLETIALDGDELASAKYDKKGHQYEYINANGGICTLSYDNFGRVISAVHEDGSETILRYDNQGNIIQVIDPVTGCTEYEYDACRRVIRTCDALGNNTRYSYDALDQLVQVTNAEGHSRKYSYDKRGNLIRLIDFNGGITTIEYNSMNRPICITDPEGNRTSYEYDLMSKPVRKIDANGAITEYAYDTESRLVRIKHPNGGVEKAEYDAVGNIIKRYTQDGGVFQFSYDALDRPVTVTEPMNGVRRANFDKLGNVVSILYEDGTEETFRYDLMGNRTAHTNRSGYTRHFKYNALNEITEISDSEGVLAEFEYGPGGQLLKEKSNNGACLEYYYNVAGDVTKVVDSIRGTWVFSYNSLRELISAEHVGEGVESYEYDLLGNICAVTNAEGNRTEYHYSKSGALNKVIDSRGTETLYRYDQCYQLMQILQTEEGHFNIDQIIELNTKQKDVRITSFTRDLEGNVTRVEENDGDITEYTYDLCGRLMSKIDGDGYLTRCSYSLDGTIDQLFFNDGKTITCQYDALKRLSQVEDWLGITRLSYDADGKLIKVTDTDGAVTSYVWNDRGACTDITYPNGQHVAYEYDKDSHLIRSATNQLEVKYKYSSNGQLVKRMFSDGILAGYEYDSLGRLKSISTSQNGELIGCTTYEYDSCGRKSLVCNYPKNGIHDELRYKYDSLGLLTGVFVNNKLSQAFSYDRFGNRTRMVTENGAEIYNYDASNRLISKTTSTDTYRYTYDRRGNLTSVNFNGQDSLKLHFDALNRLKTAVSDFGSAEYTYNAFGLCGQVKRYVNGAEEELRYIYDLSNEFTPLLTSCGSSGVENYIWDTHPIFSCSQDRSSTYVNDDRGSPLIVNTDGLIINNRFDAFGVQIAGDTTPSPFAFTGFHTDPVTQYYDAGWRQYDPTCGRFISKDPVSGTLNIPVSLNPFIYCLSEPINNLDPTGMFVIAAWLAGGIVGAAINVGTKFAGDLVNSALSGEWKFSSWQSYTGAAAGGFVQGSVLVASGGNAALAGAAGNAVETLVTNGLNMATGVEGFRKEDGYSIGQLALDTGVSAAKGAAAGSIFNWSAKYLKVPKLTAGKGSYLSVFKQVMTKGQRGIIANVTGKTLYKGLVSFGLVKTCDAIVKKTYDKAKDNLKELITTKATDIIGNVVKGEHATSLKTLSGNYSATCATT